MVLLITALSRSAEELTVLHITAIVSVKGPRMDIHKLLLRYFKLVTRSLHFGTDIA